VVLTWTLVTTKDFDRLLADSLGVADEVFIQLDVELIQRAPRTSGH
jgi:hypothetical protein